MLNIGIRILPAQCICVVVLFGGIFCLFLNFIVLFYSVLMILLTINFYCANMLRTAACIFVMSPDGDDSIISSCP